MICPITAYYVFQRWADFSYFALGHRCRHLWPAGNGEQEQVNSVIHEQLICLSIQAVHIHIV